jgi:hypothetical protein
LSFNILPLFPSQIPPPTYICLPFPDAGTSTIMDLNGKKERQTRTIDHVAATGLAQPGHSKGKKSGAPKPSAPKNAGSSSKVDIKGKHKARKRYLLLRARQSEISAVRKERPEAPACSCFDWPAQQNLGRAATHRGKVRWRRQKESFLGCGRNQGSCLGLDRRG